MARKTRLYAVPPPPGVDEDTRTLKILRRKMQQVKTRAQFEAIIANGNPEHQGRLRKLMEPMLREDLPCCGTAYLASRLGKSLQHSALCPANKLVTIQ